MWPEVYNVFVHDDGKWYLAFPEETGYWFDKTE
jgi:hypothetical protein